MPQLSIAAQIAWLLAAKEANRSGASKIEPEHFLAALTKLEPVLAVEQALGLSALELEAAREEGRIVRELLKKVGFDPEDLRHKLREHFPQAKVSREDTKGIHRSVGSRQAFKQALWLAHRFGHPRVTCSHLLIAVLQQLLKREGESPVFQAVVQPHAAQFMALISRIRARLRQRRGPFGEKNVPAPVPVDLVEFVRKWPSLGVPKRLIFRRKLVARLTRFLTEVKEGSLLLVGLRGVGKRTLLHVVARVLERVAKAGHGPVGVLALSGSSWTSRPGERPSVAQMARALVDWTERQDQSTARSILCLAGNELLAIAAFLGKRGFFRHFRKVLSDNKCRLLLTVTPGEYEKLDALAPFMLATFELLVVPELGIGVTRKIVLSRRRIWSKKYGVRVSGEACATAVDLAAKLIPEEGLPGKAIALIEKACTLERARRRRAQVNGAVAQGEGAKSSVPLVTAQSIAGVLSPRVKIGPGEILCLLPQLEEKKLLHIEEALLREVVNQRSAMAAICRRLRLAGSNFASGPFPLARFLFIGPPGVGKSHTLRVIASALTPGVRSLRVLDLSGYTDPHSLVRLLGQMPQAFYRATQSELARSFHGSPTGVVAFEHVERASPGVRKFLADWTQQGFVHDSAGCLISLHGTVVFFVYTVESQPWREVYSVAGEAAWLQPQELAFRVVPELVSVIDEVILFELLTVDALEKLAERLRNRTIRQVKARMGKPVFIHDEVLSRLAEEADRDGKGAWSLTRVWEEKLLLLLRQALSMGEATAFSAVEVACEDQKIVCRPAKGSWEKRATADLACCECGKVPQPEESGGWRWLGHLLLCPECRHRVDEIAQGAGGLFSL